MWIIAGLGNPGSDYALTRHNVGFMLVDRLAESLGIEIKRRQFQALCGQGLLGGEKILLVKPQTYMNASGMAIGPLVAYYKIEPSRLLVCYDDLDLPLGRLRLRPRGSAGGHNGMKSIIAALGTEAFPRLRVGIGRPAPGLAEMRDYVLTPFTREEILVIKEVLPHALAAIECLLTKGIEPAMNLYNRDLTSGEGGGAGGQ